MYKIVIVMVIIMVIAAIIFGIIGKFLTHKTPDFSGKIQIKDPKKYYWKEKQMTKKQNKEEFIFPFPH